MEDIDALRTRLVTKNTSSLKQLLLSKVEIFDEIRRNQNQQFNEDEIKIKELTSKLDATKETLHAENLTLGHNNIELLKEKGCLEELEAEKKRLLQEIKQLEGKYNNLKSAKPSLQDQQVLDQGKRKLKLYKDFVKIQWDYEALKHSVKGYVSNKRDYIHHFCYDKQENKLIDSLWHEIYLSACEAEIRDENLPQSFNTPTNVPANVNTSK